MRLTPFFPKMEANRSCLNPVRFFLCHSLLIPFSLSAQWQMASPSPPGGSQSLWMRPHVNHRLSCDGSCQWRASHMGLASELVCNPPSPASEVPHGSLHAFGLGIAAERQRRVAGEEREVWEQNTAPRLHKHPCRACGCDAHPERDGVNKPALPRHWAPPRR